MKSTTLVFESYFVYNMTSKENVMLLFWRVFFQVYRKYLTIEHPTSASLNWLPTTSRIYTKQEIPKTKLLISSGNVSEYRVHAYRKTEFNFNVLFSGITSSISEGNIFIYSCCTQLISFENKFDFKRTSNRAEHEYMNMPPPHLSSWCSYA